MTRMSAIAVTPLLLWSGMAAAAEAAGEGGSTGMPQLDVTTYPSQIFWLALIYGVLYYLLSRKGLPRLAEILEARQDRIAADLDRAAKLREEAEETLRRYEQLIAEAQERARQLLREAQEKLAAEYAERQAELERSLAERIAAAEKRIEESRRQALSRIGDVAAELVQIAAERLAAIRASREDAARIVARVLGETAR